MPNDPLLRHTDDLLRDILDVLNRSFYIQHKSQEILEFSAFTQRKSLEIEEQILREVRRIRRIFEPELASIQIQFKEGAAMPTPGPITLTAVGATTTAVIVGFDQFGNPWTGEIPAATFSGDNDASATVDASGLVTAVANGTTNLTGSLTTAEGLALSDVEQVIVNIAVETPVLSSIKVQFQ